MVAGKRIFQFLGEYGLLHKQKLTTRLSKFDEQKFSDFFANYARFIQELPPLIKSKSGKLDIYPDSCATILHPQLIKQISLYTDRIYIHDPIIRLAYEWETIFGFDIYTSKEDKLKKYAGQLASEIGILLLLRPLIEADIVYLTPIHTFLQGDPNAVYDNFFYSPDGPLKKRELDLPSQVKTFLDKNLYSFYGTFVDGKPRLDFSRPIDIADPNLSPTNLIFFYFAKDPVPVYYHFGDIRSFEETESGDINFYTRFQNHEASDMDLDTFRGWFTDKRLEVIETRLRHLHSDFLLASQVNAKFFTSLPLSYELARLNWNAKETSHNTLSNFLQMDLPFFEKISFESIAKARENEVALAEFRVALEKALDEIEIAADKENYEHQLQLISRDLLEIPVLKLNSEMKNLQTKFIQNAILAFGSLAISIQQGNPLSIALLMGLGVFGAKAMEAKAELDSMKKGATFFYWSVAQKSR